MLCRIFQFLSIFCHIFYIYIPYCILIVRHIHKKSVETVPSTRSTFRGGRKAQLYRNEQLDFHAIYDYKGLCKITINIIKTWTSIVAKLLI